MEIIGGEVRPPDLLHEMKKLLVVNLEMWVEALTGYSIWRIDKEVVCR
ncbi:MAG: hypothetical protein WD077_09075 [Bacteroidia bacterium]